MIIPSNPQQSCRWDTRLSEKMIDGYSQDGSWRGGTIADTASQRAALNPNDVAIIDGSTRLTFRQLWHSAENLAQQLAINGLQPGDVISFQLPNWYEAAIINLAASIGGFICNPIVPIYRDAEVAYILSDSGAKVIFIPARYRSIDYVNMIEGMRSELPELEHVFLVRAGLTDYCSFDSMTAPLDAISDRAPVSPNDVKLLLYTSGTTGRPKGVLHTHNTLAAEINACIEFWRVGESDKIFMPSPVTHITGYLYAFELSMTAGVPAILMAQWNAGEAVEIIDQHGATLTVGATPFLVELAGAARKAKTRLPTLRLFACGGAPVSPETILEAGDSLARCVVARVYGSSEAPTISLGISPTDPKRLGAETDGRIVNNDVKIVTVPDEKTAQPGKEGEVRVKGPEVTIGYTDASETASSFDDDGFFRTGDLGHIDDDGFITITGRIKDLIIRGGENLSPKEIEDFLLRHPNIQDAAVVAIPHDRLGEAPMAYLIAKDSTVLSIEDITRHLESCGLARQKFPEKIEYLDEFPRTASGKVRKNILRAKTNALSNQVDQ